MHGRADEKSDWLEYENKLLLTVNVATTSHYKNRVVKSSGVYYFEYYSTFKNSMSTILILRSG